MLAPKTRQEALDRGFKKLTDPSLLERFASIIKRKSADLAANKDAGDGCLGKKDGENCGTEYLDGKIVQCYCEGGACDTGDALVGPAGGE